MRTDCILLITLLGLGSACRKEPPAEPIPVEAVRVSLTPVRFEEGASEALPRGECQYFELTPTRERNPLETIPNGFLSYTEIVLPYSGIWEPPSWHSKGRVGDCRNGYILRIEDLYPSNADCTLLYDAYSQLDFYDYRIDEDFGVDIPGYGEDWTWYLAHFPLENWSWLKGPSQRDRRMHDVPFSSLQGRWIYIWDQANIRSNNYFPPEEGGGILALQLSFYNKDSDALTHFALRIRLDRIEADMGGP